VPLVQAFLYLCRGEYRTLIQPPLHRTSGRDVHPRASGQFSRPCPLYAPDHFTLSTREGGLKIARHFSGGNRHNQSKSFREGRLNTAMASLAPDEAKLALQETVNVQHQIDSSGDV